MNLLKEELGMRPMAWNDNVATSAAEVVSALRKVAYA